MLTGLGTGQETWGTSNLQLTKLTTLHTPTAKRREVPVLPASLETFVRAIELLGEQRRPCHVALVGIGEGRHASWSAYAGSFPRHDPGKGKRIAWAWIRKHNRPRHVAIAEIHLENKVAYALEIERTNQEHATLILARTRLGKSQPQRVASFSIAVRHEAWMAIGRLSARISMEDYDAPGTGEHFGIRIAKLEEDCGTPWKWQSQIAL
jgi:hypothetical protein